MVLSMDAQILGIQGSSTLTSSFLPGSLNTLV